MSPRSSDRVIRYTRVSLKSARPPRLDEKIVSVLILATLPIGIFMLIFRWTGSSSLFFVTQILLLSVAISLVPTFAHLFVGPRRRVVLAMTESCLFCSVVVGFSLWLFGESVFGPWIAYAFVLIVLIEAGSYIVEWHKNTLLERLSRGASLEIVEEDWQLLERMFRYEVIFYISVPLGFLLGASIGFIKHEAMLPTILLCLQILLLLASLVLLYFLALGFQRMCDPIFKTAPVPDLQIAVRRKPRLLLRVFEILVPPPPTSLPIVEDPKQKDLDIACDLSELRKIYKYDMLHNVILLVALTSTAINTWGVALDIRWLIGFLLIAALIFSEVPYAIGQYLLHHRVLERYTGSTHAEMEKKLQEYAPLFPPLPILAALMTAGTVGGFLFFLLNLFVQGALGPTK